MSRPNSFFSSLALLAIGFTALPSQATDWKYLNGFNTNGVPDGLMNIGSELSGSLVSDVYTRLPRPTNIKDSDLKLFTQNMGANIHLLQDAEITVAYIDEDEGHHNSLGFFTFPR